MSSIAQQAELEEYPVNVSPELLNYVPVSSREQMMEHGSRFVQFVYSKNANVNLRTVDVRAVNEYLRFFYFTLKTKQGKPYSPSSLICIRAGIQRYFDLVLGRRLILPGNPVFMTSNRMLGQRAREYANSSGSSVRHYTPLLPSDCELLDKYFHGNSPGAYPMEERLQDSVLFALFYYFGCTPSQHQKRINQQQQQRLFQRDELVFSVDEKGQEYATLMQSQDNPTPEFREINWRSNDSVRIYTGLDKLRAYISHLPEETNENSLFPKPLRSGCGYSSTTNRGVNYMQNFMRYLSRKARLSKLYSNHCIRLTRIRDLNQSGLSASEIRSMTGHKCNKSVRRCLKWGATVDTLEGSIDESNPSTVSGSDDMLVEEFAAELVETEMPFDCDLEGTDTE